MAGARVRRLREGDIERAIALTDLERWGYTRADFLRLLALSPEGCLAAEDAGKVVGVLSTTAYGPLAFLGAVIVDPERRGQGIGDAMMRAALDHLDGRGVETVRLNAYVDVVPFYERLGFRPEYENVRWEGVPSDGVAHAARAVRPEDLEPLEAFDATYFGAGRGALLGRLAEEFPASFLVLERAGRISGYLVGNTSSPACEVGPWVVRPGRPEAGAQLFHALAQSVDARSLAFTAPARNPEAHGLAHRLGYREVFRTLRMVRGRRAHGGRPRGIWGLAGLEKG